MRMLSLCLCARAHGCASLSSSYVRRACAGVARAHVDEHVLGVCTSGHRACVYVSVSELICVSLYVYACVCMRVRLDC